ncbi:GNAT family N-acetyltransferase [Dellaglioa sp. P0083]|uniref:GNAT family N-acetyltransferase n=1 Tax=Dellaglioa kimchii TaxID=3344667 RepID=UPI0038D4B896
MNQYETKRLVVRPLRSSDTNDIYEYACDAQVGQMAGFLPVHSLAEASLFVATLQKQSIFAIECKENQKVVGNIGLYEVVDEGQEPSLVVKEVGYALNPSFKNQGIMTEVVQGLLTMAQASGLERIIGVTTIENKASIKVLKKSNFKFIEKRAVPLLFQPADLINEIVYAVDFK